jgi:hypothetical protein
MCARLPLTTVVLPNCETWQDLNAVAACAIEVAHYRQYLAQRQLEGRRTEGPLLLRFLLALMIEKLVVSGHRRPKSLRLREVEKLGIGFQP